MITTRRSRTSYSYRFRFWAIAMSLFIILGGVGLLSYGIQRYLIPALPAPLQSDVTVLTLAVLGLLGIAALASVLLGTSLREVLLPASFLERREQSLQARQARLYRGDAIARTKQMVQQGLQQSSEGTGLPALRLKACFASWQRPLDAALDYALPANHPFPVETAILDVFDELKHRLLILGEPGAGKSIVLLRLANGALGSLEMGDPQPIPVILNLASWIHPQPSLEAWLVRELGDVYHVPEQVSRAWIEAGELLWLLDGLDQIKADLRDECVLAINEFLQGNETTQIAICSRTQDYERLSNSLQLYGTLTLQPLTQTQISQYLEGSKAESNDLVDLFQHDPAVLAMAQAPLTLRMMVQAHGNLSLERLKALPAESARRAYLVHGYIRSRLEQPCDGEDYPLQDSFRWLAWLANRLNELRPRIFEKALAGEEWLSSKRQKTAYKILSCLAIGIVQGLVLGLVLGQTWMLFFKPRLSGELLIYTLVGLLAGMLYGFVMGILSAILDQRTGLTDDLYASKSIFYQHGAKMLLVWLLGCIIIPIGVHYAVLDRRWLIGLIVPGMAWLAAASQEKFASVSALILRLMLYLCGSIPLRFSRFIEDSAKRSILLKQADGFHFCHRLIQEYLAERYTHQAGEDF